MDQETTRVAYREHVVCDQGNGGAYCSVCGYDLTSKDFETPVPNPCPGCGNIWEEGGMYVQGGGSDF